MKTKDQSKLAFAKKDLVELNDNQLYDVQGGTSPFLFSAVTFTTLFYADAL